MTHTTGDIREKTDTKEKNLKVMFSSQRDNWKTPQGFYKALDSEFNFDHDPCPSKPKEDGLISSWGGMLICESTIFRYFKLDEERI